MEDMKPCPFCKDGGDPYLYQVNYWFPDQFTIKCRKCQSKISIYENEYAAIEAWNTRYAERTYTIKPWRVEEDTGFYDCLECDCGHVMDGSEWAKSTYCPNCRAEIKYGPL